MVRLDANELLDVAYSGIGSAMLARRWQSRTLVNLDRNTLATLLEGEALCEALSQMEVFRNLRDHARRIVNSDDAISKLRRERQPPKATPASRRSRLSPVCRCSPETAFDGGSRRRPPTA